MALENTVRYYDIFAALVRDEITARLDQGDIRILGYLAMADGASSAGELSIAAALNQSSLFRATRRLEAAGLIVLSQDPEDTRIYRFDLTEEGRRINERIAELVRTPPQTKRSDIEEQLAVLREAQRRAHAERVEQRKAEEERLRQKRREYQERAKRKKALAKAGK